MSAEHATEDPRVLVIGQDPRVLGFVVGEIAAADIQVVGVTLGEVEKAQRDRFDLVAFGAGVPLQMRAKLQRSFRALNPAARFLSTYAPYAASQVVQAIRSTEAASTVDLQAYCKRIGYEGPLEPTLQTLRELQSRHIAEIPFEAIDVLLGRGIDISPAAVEAKLIRAGRGGYCYEQNGLFARVLRQIGFEVDSLAASVRWMAAPGTPPPARTHRALRVRVGDVQWLVDVGFGVSVPPAPLRLDTSEPQETKHETYRIIPLGARFLVQALLSGQWQSLYDCSTEPLLDSHYEMPNWFTSTHPSSHFRHQLIVARTTPEARYSLSEGRLTIRNPDGKIERSWLDADGIREALGSHFLLQPAEDWNDVLVRAARSTSSS
jgi:N-hydroxyarylamine O-acetyltransferase